MELKVKLALCKGKLTFGTLGLQAVVLEDKTRVISSGSISKMLHVARSGLSREQRLGDVLPNFARTTALKSFISPDLHSALINPIVFKYTENSLHVEYGYEATVVTDICKAWLAAREAGVLDNDEKALQKAQIAEHFISALSKIGILALVDEATGYKDPEDVDILQKFLSKFLREEKLEWAKRFPNKFYRELFRLKGWAYNEGSNKRPIYVGKLTNELIYRKLGPSVLAELKKRNPVDTIKQRRLFCHHQMLSQDMGIPELHDHLIEVIFLMGMHTDWDKFMIDFNNKFADPDVLSISKEGDSDESCK